MHKYNLTNKTTTTTVKTNQVLSSISVPTSNDTEIYLKEVPLTTIIGKVNLYPTKETHWVFLIDQNCCASHGGPPSKRLPKCFYKKEGFLFLFWVQKPGIPPVLLFFNLLSQQILLHQRFGNRFYIKCLKFRITTSVKTTSVSVFLSNTI